MQQTNYKKNAVFVSAGKTSLHRQLLKGDANFDLHLLIYDDSYSLFCNDTNFISVQSGYKMDMTYHYLQCHPEFLENYDYFFLMDDDIVMSTEEVNKLFCMMRKYKLKIAQPSLVMSYYTYAHTIHHPHCILRYTNFVEMMIPCFSKEALAEVLPTLKIKTRWCGIEFHWPILIKANHEDMGIIDVVHAIHTHPNRSWNPQSHREMMKYLERNNLSWDIKEYHFIPRANSCMKEKQNFDLVRVQTKELREWLYHGGLLQMKKKDTMSIVTILLLDSILWNDMHGLKVTIRLLEKTKTFLNKKFIEDVQDLVTLLTERSSDRSWLTYTVELKRHLGLLNNTIEELVAVRESPIIQKVLGICFSAIDTLERILP